MDTKKYTFNNKLFQKEIINKAIKNDLDSLSDYELLVLLCNCNVRKYNLKTISQKILDFNNGGWQNLKNLSDKNFLDVSGLSTLNKLRIKACFEIAFRIIQSKRKKMVSLNSPKSVALFFMEILRYEKIEHVIAAFFNSKASLISYKTMHVGTINSAPLSPSAILREAILCNATYIILLHNHPSGNESPSNTDRDITNRLSKCCNIMDISLKDHIIIGDNSYYSFLEHNLINT